MGYNARDKLGLAKALQIKQTAYNLSVQPHVHFTYEECENMLKTFRKATNGTNRMDRLRFRGFIYAAFCISDPIMLDLLFRAYDKNLDGNCDEVEFINGLSVMVRGTLEEQIDLCYRVYDMNGDGSLAREELYHCLRGCIYPGYGIEADEIDDAERDLVEIVMRKLDYDRDGQITYEDFAHAVKKEPLLLTAIGPCLPNVNAMATFMGLFTDDYRGYSDSFVYRRRVRASMMGKSRRETISAAAVRQSVVSITQSQIPFEYSQLTVAN